MVSWFAASWVCVLARLCLAHVVGPAAAVLPSPPPAARRQEVVGSVGISGVSSQRRPGGWAAQARTRFTSREPCAWPRDPPMTSRQVCGHGRCNLQGPACGKPANFVAFLGTQNSHNVGWRAGQPSRGPPGWHRRRLAGLGGGWRHQHAVPGFSVAYTAGKRCDAAWNSSGLRPAPPPPQPAACC